MSMPLFLMLPPHSRAVELSSLAVRRRQSRRLPHNPALPFRNSGIVGYSSYSPGSTAKWICESIEPITGSFGCSEPRECSVHF